MTVCVGCMKITEDKALDAELTKREGHPQLRRKFQIKHKNGSQPKRGCYHTKNARVAFKG